MAQGIISVSTALFEPYELMVDGVSMTDKIHMALPQSLAEWRALLMLPGEYRLLEAKINPTFPEWNITVEHETIPVTEGTLPAVLPIYTREYNEESDTHTTYLERIEVHVPTGESPMEAIKKRKSAAYVSALIDKRNPVIWQRSKE